MKEVRKMKPKIHFNEKVTAISRVVSAIDSIESFAFVIKKYASEEYSKAVKSLYTLKEALMR